MQKKSRIFYTGISFIRVRGVKLRGLVREEKAEILKLLDDNGIPSKIAKEYDIPLSTITTWKKELLINKNKNKAFNKKSINERLRLISGADFINDAEANILTAASKIISEDISDDKWFKFQEIVLKELQSAALFGAENL